MIERILVATDFSETADAGIGWAVRLAKSHGARIDLVHALLPPSHMADFLPSPPDLSAELQEAALSRLEETAEGVRASGVETEVDLRLGLPSEAIVEAATRGRCDLIVLGTRGLTGFRHLLLGSTAERVVQRAPCPVLAVHRQAVAQHRPIGKVLVPTDFSRDAEVACQTGLDLLKNLQAEATLLLLHVYHLPFEYTAYGTIPTSLSYLEDVAGAAEEHLEERARTLRDHGWRVEVVAREGFPPEIIVEEAKLEEADLVVIGTHGRSGLSHLLLGSTAERVVQHSPCPVLVVRRPGD